MNGPELIEAVGDVYEAAAAPERWPAALASVARSCGAEHALLLARPCGLAPFAVASAGLDPLTLADPSRLELAGRVAGGVVCLSVPPPASADLSPAARACLSTGWSGYLLALDLLDREDTRASLWLLRRSPAWNGGSELELARALAPHLARALSVELRVQQAERRAAETTEAFDRVALGAALVDDRARPLLLNRAARRISDEDDGFRIADDGLQAGTPAATLALRAAVREVAGDRDHRGVGLRLERPSRLRPYEVMVLPSGRRRTRLPGQRATALVFVSAPGGGLAGFATIVRDLYRLTAAEARLALYLLAGHNLVEAGRTLGLSRNTVRSELASIFRKTETTCQAELVKVLLRGPGAVRTPGESSDCYSAVDLPEPDL